MENPRPTRHVTPHDRERRDVQPATRPSGDERTQRTIPGQSPDVRRTAVPGPGINKE